MANKVRSHWWALIILALAQFMVVLDVSIVNVALPAIQKSFHMSQSSLQWIVTAYTLTFGGFLLLGGRAADLFGRRRIFMVGTLMFGAASLIDGLSQSGEMLIVLRGIQGLAAALMSPAALSMVLVSYKEGRERNTALSVWGAVASGGAAAGVLLGGVLTQYLGWRWNFFINVPVSVAVIYATWRVLPLHESEEKHNQLDLPGALSVTTGLVMLVYAIVKAPTQGWTATSTLALLAGSVILLAFFVFNELRVKHPLVPFNIFRIRNVTAANLVMMPIVAGMFSSFFFISLYAQTVLGYSPVKTGVAFLVTPVMIAIAATNVPRLLKRTGYKPILVVSPIFTAAAMFLFAHVRVNGTYAHDLLPGFILLGIGMGATFVAITIAATSGVSGRESGLASGLLNTSQQVGGALGLAILTGLASSQTAHFLKTATNHSQLTHLAAEVHGFHAAFYLASVFMLGAAVLAIVLLKQQKQPDEKTEPAKGSTKPKSKPELVAER